MEKMQQMMSKMKPEDMAKWAGRAQRFSKTVQQVKTLLPSSTVMLAGLLGLLLVLIYGHFTESF